MFWNKGIVRFGLGVVLALGAFTLSFGRLDWIQEEASRFSLSGEAVYLSDLPWATANTGWYAVGKEGLPEIGSSFIRTPITMGGVVYARGIGTYTPSEVAYRLDGRLSLFEATVGLDDDQPIRVGKTRFLVLLDGVQVYDSGPMGPGDRPKDIRIPVAGARELRLVTVEEESGGSYANWASARLLAGPLSQGEAKILASVETQKQARTIAKEAQEKELAARAKKEVEVLKALLGKAGQSSDGEVVALEDPSRGLLILTNGQLAVYLGFGVPNHGYITLLDMVSQRLIIYDTTSSFTLNDGKTYAIHTDTEPESLKSFRFGEVDDPIFGKGKGLRAQFRAKDGKGGVLVDMALFRESPYLLYQLSLTETPPGVYVEDFRYFDTASGSHVNLGEEIGYITDFSRQRRALVPDDGIRRREKVGQGKPALIWSRKEKRGLLLSALDEVRLPPQFSVRLLPGQAALQVGFRTQGDDGTLSRPFRPIFGSWEGKGAQGAGRNLSSPLLFLEVVDTSDFQRAFANYRGFITSLYPPAPLPSWVKYQWLSWYTYYMDINEVNLQEQIDYIADNLADLGPWHILVDAGWYVAEGREGAEWRNVDSRKFPSGLETLIAYAHLRGVKVVLYFSAPYLDAREREGDWLGLRGIVDEHPDWLIPLDEENYVYDFSNPGLREYMKEVMGDFFTKYNVDGIKIDGLGSGEGVFLDPEDGAQFAPSEKSILQTMNIYRFIHQVATELKDDVYIESGWMIPLTANPYAHTFRYGDEDTVFSRVYPLPGLVEHIDYASFQYMLGQRANMGAVYDYPESSVINRWWLGAGLAMGNQVVLGFDLTQLSPEALSIYRSFLSQYRPFEGETYLDGSLFPRAFATRLGETTFLGLLNRRSEPQEISVELGRFGFGPQESYVAYDVEKDTFFTGQGSLSAQMEGQSFRLFVLRSRPGVLWTDGSFQVDGSEGELRIKVRGPETLEGFMHIYVPDLRAFSIDGEWFELGALQSDSSIGHYDPDTKVLSLRNNYDREREIIVELP